DLKPENIMHDSKTGATKIVDLGSALQFQDDFCVERKRVGTSYYIAPEVLNRFYNQKCDVWSLGIILYIMLCGEPPFRGVEDDEILDKVKNGVLEFRKAVWGLVSDGAKKFLGKILERNVKKRLSIDELLEESWMKEALEIAQQRVRAISWKVAREEKWSAIPNWETSRVKISGMR
ncbi:unnamed protein product, partial [Sphagnum balticum]